MLDADDLAKPLTAIVLGRGISSSRSESIRFDFDGGRIIIATKDSEQFDQNLNNQERELYFLRRDNK